MASKCEATRNDSRRINSPLGMWFQHLFGRSHWKMSLQSRSYNGQRKGEEGEGKVKEVGPSL